MRGSKSCPQCETSVGPRTRICPKCNFEFVFKIKHSSSTPTIALPRVVGNSDISSTIPLGAVGNGRVVLVPAGKCPVSYKGNWEEWVGGLKTHANRLGVTYSVGVFTYWAHMEGYVDKFTDDGKKALRKIEEIAQNEH